MWNLATRFSHADPHRTARLTLWPMCMAAAVFLAPASALAGLAMTGLEKADLWTSQWVDKSGEQKLWLLRNADSSLTFGGVDSASSFGGVCVLVEAKRALCTGEGLTAEPGGGAVRRFTYSSELRRDSGSLTENWEARVVPKAEESGQLSPDQLLRKGQSVYARPSQAGR